MGDKEGRLFPHFCEQIVKVIRGRCAVAGADALSGIGRMEKAELTVVDEFPLLPLLDALDRQAHLLLYLVIGLIVEVGNPCMDTHNGLYGLQRVLTGFVGVIDIGFRYFNILRKTGNKVNVLFTMFVDGRADFKVFVDRCLKSLFE